MKWLILVAGLTLVSTGSARYEGLEDYEDYQSDYDSQYAYEDNSYEQVNKSAEEVQRRNPKFVTTEKVMMLNEGGTVKLPCHVDNLDGFMIIWKKDEQDMIALGDKVLKADSRIKIESTPNGNSLIISLAEASDAGRYVCQLNTPDLRILTHTVNIRVPPVVSASPTKLEVNAGQSAVLRCTAEKGEPKPELYWTRKTRLFRSGEAKILGDTLELASVDRHDTGHYICHGDNGWNHPANSTVQLQVLHKPEIEQQELFIHTHKGAEVEVTCIVHAAPAPTVEWYRNGQLLDPTNSVIGTRGNRHTLYINNIGNKNTHGKYMCRAVNNLGESSKVTVVSGVAKAVHFTSDRMGSQTDRFNLIWWTESNSNVEEFRVQYRPVTMEEGEWRTEFTTAEEISQNVFEGKLVLENLLDGTEYNVRVESKNIYGWSDHNQQFSFLTEKSKVREVKPQKELKQVENIQPTAAEDVEDEPKPKYEPSVSTDMESGSSLAVASCFLSTAILLRLGMS